MFSLFGNVMHPLTQHVEIGLELSYWQTEYKGRPDADALRAQLSFVYHL